MGADTDELRRRIAAAAAYGGFSQDTLADKIGMSKSTYNRRLKELSEPRRRDPFLTLIADRCGLTAEFFTVDFKRLPELADDGGVTTPATPELDELQATVRLLAEQMQEVQLELRPLVLEAHQRNEKVALTTKRPLRKRPA